MIDVWTAGYPALGAALRCASTPRASTPGPSRTRAGFTASGRAGGFGPSDRPATTEAVSPDPPYHRRLSPERVSQ